MEYLRSPNYVFEIISANILFRRFILSISTCIFDSSIETEDCYKG